MESELFGHVKGAFTGADKNKQGIMESADTGTLFLDEVGELPLDLQVKLLRVLQEGEVRRVGSPTARKVDFRLVTATHRNLEKDTVDGRFRPDLFFRLNVITLKIPPLRDRKEDISLLAAHFIKSFCSQYGMPVKSLSKPAQSALAAHLWPGNVRELENKLHKAVILSNSRVITPADLGMETIRINEKERCQSGWPTLKSTMESTRKETIEKSLERTGGNISRAAGLLDINRRVLTRFISQHGINPKAFKS
jgi:transcriptional regulator with PAS, ATPase and Fis domain